MNRTNALLLAALAATSWVLIANPPVDLQPTTPGTQQDGHINVSGKILSRSLGATDAGATAIAVNGLSSSTTGATYGGLFRSASASGRAIRAYNMATSGGGIGGDFQADGPTATAIKAIAAGNGANIGIYAKTNSPTGLAGQFIGTVNVAGSLSLTGTSLAPAVAAMASAPTGQTFGGRFESVSPDGTGLLGLGQRHGIYGQSEAPTGIGAYGAAVETTGANFGGFFKAAGAAGTGVFGWATSTFGQSFAGKFFNASANGVGVEAEANSGTGNTIAGNFRNNSTSGIGVKSVVTAATGNTVAGQFTSASVSGTAVRGLASATTGANRGGYFSSSGDDGRGIEALALSTSGATFGAILRSDSGDGIGALCQAISTSGANYGVRGMTASFIDGFGVFSVGNMGASGTKPFRIDHPFDPENKYLLHYAAEGPEPNNLYSGTVTTDSKGEAWVQLPDYYGEINKDPRYVLTVVDEEESNEFVQVKVARKIRDNRFMIRTSAPQVEVSWMVMATRNDRFVRTYGAPVEVQKSELERGTYQHPELYGKPKGMSLGAARGKGGAKATTARR